MDFLDLLKRKQDKNIILKDRFSFLKTYKPLGLIKISDKTLLREIRDGLVELPSSFIIELEGVNNEKIGKNLVVVSQISKIDLIGFDFIICDNDIKELNIYLDKGIVPIIPKVNNLKNILKEFNPIKNEGNAFFYDKNTKWSIYASLIRYLENYKFPFDNKSLVKNIINT